MSAEPLLLEELEGGRVWQVKLNAPPGNILDVRTFEGLTAIAKRAAETADLRAIVIAGAGEHFSYGASIQQHRVPEVEALLQAFHDLCRHFLQSGAFLLAAVRGQCLGGGLELATLCHRIVSSPAAHFGQPEIRLGVFAPVAAILLPERVSRARAEELLITGKSIDAREALAIGLVDQVAEDPVEAAVAYAPAAHWAGDGVHPSAAGAALMAATWLRAVGMA